MTEIPVESEIKKGRTFLIAANFQDKNIDVPQIPADINIGFKFALDLMQCEEALSNTLSEYTMKGYEFPMGDVRFY